MIYELDCQNNERIIDRNGGFAMGNVYSYMRISTAEERGKQGYSRQEKALEAYAKRNRIDYVLGLQEDVSGKSFANRKEWQRLEKIVQSGDTIVFKDLCRFTRQAEQGYDKYMALMQKGIDLVFIDNPTVSTNYIKNLLNIAEQQELVTKTVMESMVKILLIAELDRSEKERLLISSRTKDGLAARKKQSEEEGREWHIGRPIGKLDKMSDALRKDIIQYQSDRSIKQVDLMRKHNISRNTLKKYIAIITEESREV